MTMCALEVAAGDAPAVTDARLEVAPWGRPPVEVPHDRGLNTERFAGDGVGRPTVNVTPGGEGEAPGEGAVEAAVAVLAQMPLRQRLEILRQTARELFVTASAAVIDWGDDAELSGQPATVDDELEQLACERRALVDVTVGLVELTRSLEATTRVVADHHARVVSRFDTLDLDQLDRRLSSPATALAGEFAGDDFAPVLGISAVVAAHWASLGAAMRARHPRLLAIAGQGRVSMRACLIVTQELDHLDAEQVPVIEAAFLTGDAIHGSEASIRKNLRALLDHHGMARSRDEDDDSARICLGFNEFPEQPTLTELNVVMPADDAWRLNTAVEHRARELAAEWFGTHGTPHGYPMRRARVDALLDLALGNVRFRPDVRINVPVTLTRTTPLDPLTPWAPESSTPPPISARPPSTSLPNPWGACPPSRPGSESATARSITIPSDTALGHGASVAAAAPCVDTNAGALLNARPTLTSPSGVGLRNARSYASRLDLIAACDAAQVHDLIGASSPAATVTPAPAASRHAASLGPSHAAPSTRAEHGPWRIADLEVPGIGRVSAGALLALGETLGAGMRVALSDAATGVTAWTTSRSYRPAAAVRRFVVQRDAHCRFPGCMRPAPMCDVDHVVPHAAGGATSPSNLQLLCRHHHRAKTHGAWAVAMTADGTCVWQSPTGTWLCTHPSDATAYRTSAEDALALIA